jgi:Serine dehydrogenase proteinase
VGQQEEITMPKKTNFPSKFTSLADKIAKRLDADLLFYNAPIERHFDQRVIELCNSRRRRKNVALFLITSGGDADAAYRIAACLQNKYAHFSLFVPGYCKSAGTLIALGAHQIIISDHGENGPLDVQLVRKDELLGSESGLTATTSLQTLNKQAFLGFEYFLLQITRKAGLSLSTKTVTDIAVKMTTGLFCPIYQQIDPTHVGEAERALEIARAYGYRLVGRSQNLRGETTTMLDHLISHYPSHGFIIDYAEAKEIFKNVRNFTTDETTLMSYLGPVGRWPVDRQEDCAILFLSGEVPAARSQRANVRQNQSRPKNQPRTGARNTASSHKPSPTVIPQIPAAEGIHKRHA